ncbi:spidroin-2-like [Saccostrea echinata]|uniref:spidroin-2-like n=1 Tax=Saccostrea echinata TaxID=191078 RepID=UPI002A82A828|nr:spidroin-2-like [Saccostrea echinata]
MFRAAFLFAFLAHALADYEYGGCNGYGCTYGKTHQGPGGVGSTVVSTGGSGSLNFGHGFPNFPPFGFGPSSAASGAAASGLGGAAASSAAASGGPFGGSAASSAAAAGSASQPRFQYQLDPSFVGTGFQGFQRFQQFGFGGSTAAGAAASGDDGSAAAAAATANGAGAAASSAAAAGRDDRFLLGFPGSYLPPQGVYPALQPRLPTLLPGFPTRTVSRYPVGVPFPRVPALGPIPFPPRRPRKPFGNKKKVPVY